MSIAHKIIHVREGSPAQRHGLKENEELISINGEEIIDDVDYQMLSSKKLVRMSIRGTDGKIREVSIVNTKRNSLGLQLDNHFACNPKICKNRCTFCFVDQMPPDLRPSLYVKDDDWRMSLMMGNFVTLTNVDEAEFDRILRRKASPLFVSVHTTNPTLRVNMMKHRDAKCIMERLNRLAEAKIKFHMQIVLCPGHNDGEELERTLNETEALFPYAASAALVPVGLTKFRKGLAKLTMYDMAGAKKVLEQAHVHQQKMLEKHGTRFVFPSDEFYCIAKADHPSEEEYEGYPQIENGVGLVRKYEEELKQRYLLGKESGEKAKKRKMLVACGTSILPIMKRWITAYAPLQADISAKSIDNHFFGTTISVTGLLTGGDISQQIMQDSFDELLLSSTTLRSEGDMFLDNMTLEKFREILSPRKVTIIEQTGADLYEAMLGTNY